MAKSSPIGSDVKASRARRFDVLDRPPPTTRRRSGEMVGQFLKRAEIEKIAHERRMLELLCEKFGINPRASNPNAKLLTAMIRTYIPAFNEGERRKVGRPSSGISAYQQWSIDRAVKADQSIRSACLKLVKGEDKERRAKALAEAYRRATK